MADAQTREAEARSKAEAEAEALAAAIEEAQAREAEARSKAAAEAAKAIVVEAEERQKAKKIADASKWATWGTKWQEKHMKAVGDEGESDDESTISGELGRHQEERPSTPFDDAMSLATDSAQSYMSGVSSTSGISYSSHESSMSVDSYMFADNSQSIVGQFGADTYVQAGGAAVCVCMQWLSCLCVCAETLCISTQ